ncbi:serine hydrolase domain-containing protein [Streptomyces sp. NPDC002039]|uniref:serine hydrolase domain-containing protein n=1 Tax=Streptomyces sp. NPDC002039 TaxID=3154660 RepID=UPI00333127FE
MSPARTDVPGRRGRPRSARGTRTGGSPRARARTVLPCVAALIAAALPTAAGRAAAPEPAGRPCVASAQPDAGQPRRILDIARQAVRELHLNAVVVRVERDGREVVTGALGESMTGVPATADMRFRSGAVAIAYLGTVLLQLVDEGKVGLDDPVSRWLPDLPHAEQTTLRMLGGSTTGLRDYVPDPRFVAELYANPFRQWTPRELIALSTDRPLLYAPGTNWSYSHANFVILGAALEKITGTPLDRLLRERVMGPLGMRNTTNAFTAAIPDPVLHSFDAERGKYEESTFWNPSWTTARGAVLTTDVCDLARSARAIGAGELISPSSLRTQLNPGTVGLGTATRSCPASVCFAQRPDRHFGLGVVVQNDWVTQTPSFAGYAAIQAYLPAERLAIAVATTIGPNAPEGNTAQTVAERIAAALAPSHPLAK